MQGLPLAVRNVLILLKTLLNRLFLLTSAVAFDQIISAPNFILKNGSSCIVFKVKRTTTNSTNPCFYLKRRFGRVSSVHFQALMMKKFVTSITISEPQLVIMVMFNLIIRRK